MRKNSSGVSNSSPAYFLQYDRCIKQHHFSPKIFICVEECCQNKNLLCHYCINDSYHNFTSAHYNVSSEKSTDNQISHKGHKVMPIEEYINIFRNLYYNAKPNPISPVNASSTLSSSSSLFSPKSQKNCTSLNQGIEASNSTALQGNKDWKEKSQEKYLKYLKCLKNQISEIYQFVEVQIKETEEMIVNCFQNLSQHEKDIEESYSYFDSKEDEEEEGLVAAAASSKIVQQFVNTSFHFLIDSQSRKKCSANGGGYLEIREYSQDDQSPISLITQKDIQTKIQQQFNHIKKIADYFQSLSNDIQKRFSNGLLTTPFFESSIDSSNQTSNNLSESPIKAQRGAFFSSDTLSSSSSQLLPSTQLGQIVNSSFGNNTNMPENIFSVRSPSQKISDIHTKSIWRVLHLYKSVCASCSSDGTIKIWDFRTQQMLKIFNSFNDAVNDLIYLSQQKLLVSVSGDNKIRIFSLQNYKCIRTIEGHLNAIYTCHYDPHANILLTAGREEEVYGWNIITGEKLFKTKSIQRSIYSLQSISSKDSFLCGDEGGTLSIFNYKNPQLIRSQTIHSKTIYSIKIIQIQNIKNNQDKQIVTCSADGYIRITSFEKLDVLNQVKLNSFIYDMSIHMNRIFAQIGKTSNLAIIGLTQQRGNIEITTKVVGLSNPNKVRCLQIVKDQNILLYESTLNDTNFDINIESF